MNGDLFTAPAAGRFPAPRAFQATAHEKLREGVRAGHRRQLLVAPTGAGKCLGRDTPVLMADGTVRLVQHVQAGEQLLGPDGSPRNVLSVTRGREALYRVIPKKGMSYVCNASHILSLRKTPGSDAIVLANGERIAPEADVVNVNVEVFAASNKTARHCLKGWRSDALEFPLEPVDLTLDPYLLGCWLGDGSQRRFAISKPESRMVDEWRAAAARFGYEVVETRGTGDCPTWTIVSRDPVDGRPYNLYLGALDCYGLRERKHIPHDYKVAPVPARLQLLAGMIDSDGHMSHAGYDWISKSRELAEDFAFVCRSVGLAAYVAPTRKGIASTGFVGDYWRVSVSGDCSAIPCRDKPAPERRQKKRHLVHGIRVEPIGEGDYFGFEIDGDHLFLLGDFTVTHNTYLGLRIVHEALQRGKRAVFICDRTALINQTSARADDYGLTNHGIVQANHPRRDNTRPFQIASVQTLQARDYGVPADVVVIDEAHTQYEFTKQLLERIHGDARTVAVGLTATPCTKGLGLTYDAMVNAATMAELVECGVLVPMRVYTCTTPDMRDVARTRTGEWEPEAAGERSAKIIGDVVAEWLKLAEGRKTIAFGASIAYCQQLAGRFNEAGVRAEVYTSETPDDVRAVLLKEFEKVDSDIRVLISVDALAKGFDVQDVGCVIDARPLRKSLSTAIQMWGRGLRSSPATGKTDCILLDHSGNVVRFREDFERVYFDGFSSLDESEKLDRTAREDEEGSAAPQCPACSYTPFFKRCMSCGYEKPVQAMVEEAPGVMQEIRIGKRVAASNKADLWAQLCTYGRAHIRTGKASGWAWYKYQEIAGEKPPRNWKFDTTPDVPVSSALIGKLKAMRIAWHKGRGVDA